MPTTPAPTFTRLNPAAFTFLRNLKKHNNRDWFQDHKATYHTELREPFIALLEDLTQTRPARAIKVAGGRDTMFRINRDTRLSANKAPYNTHISGMLTPSGGKCETDGVIYLHLDTTGGFVASGYYQLPTPLLNQLRQHILDEPAAFKRLLKNLEKAGLAFDTESSLKRMPRGFEPHADHPLADHLKLKSYIVRHDLTPDAWKTGAVKDTLTQFITDSKPLLAFGHTALQSAN